LVTINSGALWNEGTYAITPVYEGGITNNGTFTAGSGIHTFNTNNQALTGTFSIPNVTITGFTLTNNNTLTAGTALSGTGGLTQASSSTLTIAGISRESRCPSASSFPRPPRHPLSPKLWHYRSLAQLPSPSLPPAPTQERRRVPYSILSSLPNMSLSQSHRGPSNRTCFVGSSSATRVAIE
jgi:hypothetical protein